MTVQARVSEEELREVFADTLDRGTSRSAILVQLHRAIIMNEKDKYRFLIL